MTSAGNWRCQCRAGDRGGGGAAARKGLDRLIAALPAIRQRHPDAILLLVGDGPERPALETMAAHLGLSRYVRFAGVRHDVPRF